MSNGTVRWLKPVPTPETSNEVTPDAVSQKTMFNGKTIVEGSRNRLRRSIARGERPYTAVGIGNCHDS